MNGKFAVFDAAKLFLKVKFPYCTEDEMAEMERTINTAFSDIQSNATLKKALTVYKHTHKKVMLVVLIFVNRT